MDKKSYFVAEVLNGRSIFFWNWQKHKKIMWDWYICIFVQGFLQGYFAEIFCRDILQKYFAGIFCRDTAGIFCGEKEVFYQ